MSPQGPDIDLSIYKRNLQFIQFKYSTLSKATDDFNESRKLGQGGYGEVYMVRFPFKLYLFLATCVLLCDDFLYM